MGPIFGLKGAAIQRRKVDELPTLELEKPHKHNRS